MPKTLPHKRLFPERDAPLDNKADIVLFATHGDDDQLFFAGLLSYYAGEVGCGVQDHRNLTKARTHKMLNSLWNVGVRVYPVFGAFDNFRIDDLQGTYDYYQKLGHSKEELQSFVVEQIRRFKPQVAVGHDSQQYTWFTKWINWVNISVGGTPITKATQIKDYNPCKFGLYRSTAGTDIKKNDFLENIVTYAEQERLEQKRKQTELVIAIIALVLLISALAIVLIIIQMNNIRRHKRRIARRSKNIR